MRNPLALFLSICFCGIFQPQQDDQYEVAFRRAQRDNYLNVLKKYEIAPSADGAFQLLQNLRPNAVVKDQIIEQIEKLKSRKFADRERAEKNLASFGPVALSILNTAIEMGDPETQMRAGRVVKKLNSYSGIVSSAAINVLKFDDAKTPSPAKRIQLLLDLQRSGGDAGFQSQLSDAIIYLASPATRDMIVEGIGDENVDIRISCVRAIKRCVSDQELLEFRDFLSSDDALLSMAAIESFGHIAPSESVQTVIERHLISSDLETRRSAVNFLRAISMQHFGFNVAANEDERQVAVEKWIQWYSENKPITIDNYQRMLANANKEPIGMLVTVNGQGVRNYDFKGILNWKIDGQAYDAQYVRPNVALVTYRSAGQVKLLQGDSVLQTVSGLNSPSDADYLENGNVLVAHGSGIVTEHDSTGKEILRFEGFSNPFDADRLSNGNTLVADSSNNRIVELDSTGVIVWQCGGINFPNNVFRLPDGRTLYSTYTSGVVGLLGVDGTKLWQKKIGNATLYSVYCAQGKVYVSDGANRKIWILDMSGVVTGQISVPESFCDVSFVTR